MKLISMVEFVLQMGLHSTSMMEKGMIMCNKYANFLSQPLELWMFVPCDEEGNVLEELSKINGTRKVFEWNLLKEQYQAARERCLFERDKTVWRDIEYNGLKTVEQIANKRFDLNLTPTAQKQIGV